MISLRSAATAALSVLVATASIGGVAPPADAAVAIAPHRASYKLSLAGSRNGSPIAGVSGNMTFAWGDACDGWTTEQRFQMRFSYAQGEESEVITSYTTWEAKDGGRYRFVVRKQTNGQMDEELKGDATLDGDKGGKVVFTKPKEATVDLPAGTMFPSAHTEALLDMAGKGEPFFARPVFDGSEIEGATTVTAVLGRKAAAPELPAAELRTPDAWNVTLAFYPKDEQEAMADYETGLVLLTNGVVQSMLIDYGDFKVNAELEKIEAMPKGPC
ncbi:MAG TPA: cell envelope integrity EipB family protein [Azospirillaceae bacterium]|nr:cell envelope integrity EipB family protein [Azospirillaceae bacterium]